MRKTFADSCLVQMCDSKCWLCVRGEMYIAGLTESIDVKQLDGNVDVDSHWLDPRFFLQQQYSKLHGIFLHYIKAKNYISTLTNS